MKSRRFHQSSEDGELIGSIHLVLDNNNNNNNNNNSSNLGLVQQRSEYDHQEGKYCSTYYTMTRRERTGQDRTYQIGRDTFFFCGFGAAITYFPFEVKNRIDLTIFLAQILHQSYHVV